MLYTLFPNTVLAYTADHCGVFTSFPISPDESLINVSILVDPGRLGTAAHLTQESEAFIAWALASPPAAGSAGVQLPGDPERATRAERLRHGIAVDAVTWQEIVAAGAKVGVDAASLQTLASAP